MLSYALKSLNEFISVTGAPEGPVPRGLIMELGWCYGDCAIFARETVSNRFRFFFNAKSSKSGDTSQHTQNAPGIRYYKILVTKKHMHYEKENFSIPCLTFFHHTHHISLHPHRLPSRFSQNTTSNPIFLSISIRYSCLES